MEIGLRVPLEGEIVREGSVVLPARLVVDVVRALPGDEVSLELRPTEQDVEIVGGSATFHIRTLRSEDFPPFPEPEGDRVLVPGDAFVATVAKVARSASRDETRPVLTGILVSATGDELRMVATDSYRLSVKETKLEAPLSRRLRGQRAGAGAAGAHADRPARERRASSRVSVRANQVVFEAGGVVLSSRLIDGQFPNYRQLLPDAYEHALRLAGGEISEVVRRISLLAQKNAPLRLAFTEGELTVSARTPDVGEARETLPVPFAGEPLEIGFNPEFLRDGLEAVEGGDVVAEADLAAAARA